MPGWHARPGPFPRPPGTGRAGHRSPGDLKTAQALDTPRRARQRRRSSGQTAAWLHNNHRPSPATYRPGSRPARAQALPPCRARHRESGRHTDCLKNSNYSYPARAAHATSVARSAPRHRHTVPHPQRRYCVTMPRQAAPARPESAARTSAPAGRQPTGACA